jgi:photosystem I subunit 3
MSRLLSILLSAFLFLGIAPIANARPGPALNADRAPTDFTASALVSCADNPRFQERASTASTDQAIKRFERYSKALCGDDGLPHLIIGPPLEPWGALLNRRHEGDLLIPGVLFIYIAGIIGWSGREYLIESKKTKNPADLEIIIDLDLARKCLVKGAQWPLLANKQGRNGDLREKDNNITLNGPR